jgi:hypothetical protein
MTDTGQTPNPEHVSSILSRVLDDLEAQYRRASGGPMTDADHAAKLEPSLIAVGPLRVRKRPAATEG